MGQSRPELITLNGMEEADMICEHVKGRGARLTKSSSIANRPSHGRCEHVGKTLKGFR